MVVSGGILEGLTGMEVAGRCHARKSVVAIGHLHWWFFYRYIIQQPLKDDFLQVFFFEKKFLLKNVRSGVNKKNSLFGGRL